MLDVNRGWERERVQ